MMKIYVIVSALVAICAAKPAIVSAPIIAAAPAPIVTASSSQYYHRINNGIATYVAAPAAYVASAAPAAYVASAAPVISAPYIANPYFGPGAAQIVSL